MINSKCWEDCFGVMPWEDIAPLSSRNQSCCCKIQCSTGSQPFDDDLVSLFGHPKDLDAWCFEISYVP